MTSASLDALDQSIPFDEQLLFQVGFPEAAVVQGPDQFVNILHCGVVGPVGPWQDGGVNGAVHGVGDAESPRPQVGGGLRLDSSGLVLTLGLDLGFDCRAGGLVNNSILLAFHTFRFKKIERHNA